MKKAFWIACSLAGVLACPSLGDDPTVVRKPMSLWAMDEFGPIVDGVYKIGDANAEPTHMDWLDHFGAAFDEEAVVADRLHLSAGLGGVFEFRKPELPGLAFPTAYQGKGFFIGPARTEAVYDIGDIQDPWLKLGVGMFSYKYNPEAADLGEYLFRAYAYPTINTTGGYVILNNAAAQLQGFKANFHKGDFKADVFLITETSLAPLYDWSLAGVVQYTAVKGLLDLGAGVNFQHLLQVKPSRTATHFVENSYFNYNGTTYSGASSFYKAQSDFDATLATKLPASDSVRIQALNTASAQFKADGALVDSLNALALGAPGAPSYNYYTAAGTLLMARATLDIKKLFESSLFGSEDLKLYSEVDVLGLKDYPVFYTSLKRRIPIMVGFNFPGFKILDLIAMQMEYFNSPWMNNTFERGHQAANIPYFPGATDAIMSVDSWNDAATKDNVKWSILVKKNIFKNLTFSAQAADDHMRITSSNYYYGPQFDHNEVTAFQGDWYCMTQLSWGL